MGSDQALIAMLNPMCIISIIGLIFDISYIYDMASNVVYQYDNYVIVGVLFIGGIASLVIAICDINNSPCKKIEFILLLFIHILIFLIIILNVCMNVDSENFSGDIKMIKSFKIITSAFELVLLSIYVLNIVFSYKYKHNVSSTI